MAWRRFTLTKIVDGDDVRMIQPRQHAAFAGESVGESRVGSEGWLQKLQRNQPLQFWLARLEYKPHAALADQFEDFELGKSCRQLLPVRRWRFCGGFGLSRD
jgi:hypothetical protein